MVVLNKYVLIALIFIVVFVAGYFGQHFGYTVHGIPMGEGADYKNPDNDWRNSAYGLDVVIAYWQQKFQDNAIVQSISYIYWMSTFSIDGCPAWMSGIFDLILLLCLVLVFVTARGSGD